ncbi:LemA family protein [Tepidibacillus fermentans]|uniref:LemA protein n=1 Tax=Tepidibacillus fermentans TaxID=1281767 RepID=A0A4R3KIN1_9BACI|nr:LemA family protein [Tepidibacillus fermentans]TCS83134.1 LemA protein [Tepidibacillus fermentans]
MKKGTIILIVIVAIFAILAFSMIGSYNSFVSQEEAVNQSFAQIQTQLQRRMDLIPNLVNTVKGYAAHEKEVLQGIADARARLAGARTPLEMANANTELNSALSRLIVVVERYPNLKADRQFTQLMDELAGTENRIATARRDYNTAVQTYNQQIKRFPGVIVARLFGFEPKEYFQADENAQKAPSVDFGSQSK